MCCYSYQNVASLLFSLESVHVLCHVMVCLAKKLDMFRRSETAGFLCCYLICACLSLLQGLESDDDDKKL